MTSSPLIFDRNGAIFERHTYRHDGLNLVAWVIRPPGPGPFPLLIINHGSGIVLEPDGTWADVSSRYGVDPENPAWARLAESGALTLLPEGRGYGGSDGPSPLDAARGGTDATFAMLVGRASDANAAADWACGRPDVDAARCVIAGASHGGVVSLLGVEGHHVYDPANARQMRPDYVAAIQAGFSASPSAPEDPPERWTNLDFLLPAAFPDDAPRWAGRFGEDGPDAMVALAGDQAVYCWKDCNSRGYGEGRVAYRGDIRQVEPWPGVTLHLEALPGGALQITYERDGERSIARLDPVYAGDG